MSLLLQAQSNRRKSKRPKLLPRRSLKLIFQQKRDLRMPRRSKEKRLRELL
jgi:hypothetical protein